MAHALVIVWIWGSVGLVFTQPHIFLEVDECQNSLFEAIRKYRLHRK